LNRIADLRSYGKSGEKTPVFHPDTSEFRHPPMAVRRQLDVAGGAGS